MHSQWLRSASRLSQADLRGLARTAGLQVIPFGVPLSDPQAPDLVRSWLETTSPTPVIPQLNTLALPTEQQNEEGLRALFATWAPIFAQHSHVLLVAGANEPLTKGKGWASAQEAIDRVALEHRLWGEVSSQPFCHKFTPPRINTEGLDWAKLGQLWEANQDAICYDWYPGNKDPLSTLDHLRAEGQRVGKPIHVLETRVPEDDPAVLRDMARGLGSVSIYQLAATAGGSEEKFGAWLLRDGVLEERAAGAMIRQVTGAPAS